MHKISRRQAACLLALPAVLGTGPLFANAPAVRILVGFGAGGATDGVARVLSQALSTQLGTPVIVENRPGANQILAIQALKVAAPDGNTLFMGTGSSLAQNPALREDIGYDPDRDFTPVALLGRSPGVIAVSPTLSATSIESLVTVARGARAGLNYGSSGIGSANHLATEFFLKQAGLEMTHVPLKSDGAVGIELAEGRIDIAIMTLQVALPLAKAGRIRLLMVTSMEPVPAAPELPTLDSAPFDIRGLDPYTFFGIVGPHGMADERVRMLNQAVNKAWQTPAVQANVKDTLLLQSQAGSAADFAAYLTAEYAKWKALRSRIRL